MGWAPKEEMLGNVTMDETALLAVLIALYPMPESYSSARKLITSSTEGQMGSMPVVMHARIGRNQSGAGKDNRLLFGEQWILLFSKSNMAATNVSQLGAGSRIQDGGADESRPGWKTAHQPRRRTGIGLTDFHGDTNHARVTQKNVMQLQTR